MVANPKQAVKLTYEDYSKTPEDERYELIDGELIMAPSPNRAHQTVQAKLGSALHARVQAEDLGEFFFTPFDVVLSMYDTVQPDLIFVSNENADVITDANIRGAPDLVVEIISPSSTARDWVVKRDLYARHGVKEYWVIDPVERTVWTMILDDRILELAATLREGDTLSSETVSGFSVNVSDIF